MSTEIRLGTPGAGKTISIISQIILPECSKLDSRYYRPEHRRRILTNIDGITERLVVWKYMTDVSLSDLEAGMIRFGIDEDIWDYDIDEDLKGNQIFKFKYLRDGDIVVYDEAQIAFPKDFTKGERYDKFVAMMTQHRKYHLDFYFLTQDPNNLTKCIFGLVDATYYLRKRRFFGSSNSYTEHMYNGGSTTEKSKLGKKVRKYDPDCFKLYNSHKVQGIERVRTFNVFLTPKMLVLYAVILSCFVFPAIYFSTHSLFGTPVSKSKPVQKTDGQNNNGDIEIAVSPTVEISGFVINENLCQASTDQGLLLLPSVVCGHLPYNYLGKTYIQRTNKNDESGKLF